MHHLVCAALLFLLSLSWCKPATSSPAGAPRYNSIFSFGDSFADTGNNPVVFGWYSVFDPVTRPPYGTTFFGRHTGRNGNGRLIIDFIAENLGLPYVPPTLAHNGSFHRGANFAVGAATALDAGFFHERDIPGGSSKFPLNTSLDVQLEWFESMKPSLCRTAQECKKFLGRSLFLVGEFGVNDYHFSFQRKTVQEVRSFVPDVVATISVAIEELYCSCSYAVVKLYKSLENPHLQVEKFISTLKQITSHKYYYVQNCFWRRVGARVLVISHLVVLYV